MYMYEPYPQQIGRAHTYMYEYLIHMSPTLNRSSSVSYIEGIFFDFYRGVRRRMRTSYILAIYLHKNERLE